MRTYLAILMLAVSLIGCTKAQRLATSSEAVDVSAGGWNWRVVVKPDYAVAVMYDAAVLDDYAAVRHAAQDAIRKRTSCNFADFYRLGNKISYRADLACEEATNAS